MSFYLKNFFENKKNESNIDKEKKVVRNNATNRIINFFFSRIMKLLQVNSQDNV